MRAKDEQTLEACPRAYVALKPTAPGFKYATDRGLIAPEVPVAFYLPADDLPAEPATNRSQVNEIDHADRLGLALESNGSPVCWQSPRALVAAAGILLWPTNADEGVRNWFDRWGFEWAAGEE